MSWLSRVSQAKPMALPVRAPSDSGGRVPQPEGIHAIDSIMTEESAEREKGAILKSIRDAG